MAQRLAPALLLAAVALLAVQTVAALEPGLTATVVRVVDGDTIQVRVGDQTEKVRYIGIDAPETRHPTRGEEPGGREATAVNRHLVDGRTVRLELDVRHRDRYGRLLAYVHVDGIMVNAELVRLGYAHAVSVPPNVRHQHALRALERQARDAGRGLWSRL